MLIDEKIWSNKGGGRRKLMLIEEKFDKKIN